MIFLLSLNIWTLKRLRFLLSIKLLICERKKQSHYFYDKRVGIRRKRKELNLMIASKTQKINTHISDMFSYKSEIRKLLFESPTIAANNPVKIVSLSRWTKKNKMAAVLFLHFYYLFECMYEYKFNMKQS